MSRRRKPPKIHAANRAPVRQSAQEPSQRVVLKTATHTTTSLSFQGPLPPPDVLEHYGRVAPDGAHRIIAMAESQLAHRQRLETTVVEGNVNAQARGQFIAALVAILTIGGGTWLIAHDKDVQGLVAILGTLITLAGIFLYGRHEQAEERKTKRQEAKEPQAQRMLPLEPHE